MNKQTETPDGQRGDPGGSDEVLTALTPLLKRVSGEIELPHRGTSMAPALPDGVMLRIRCDAPADSRVGQIVVFRGTHGLTTHRLVYRTRRRDGDHVLCRGDARRLPDAPLPVARIMGVVTRARLAGEWVTPAGPPPVSWGVRAVERVMGRALNVSVGLADALFAVLTGFRWVVRWLRRVRSTLTR